MSEEKTDQILQALSHAARRKILDIVRQQPGCTVSNLASYFDTSRIAVMKHLRILEAADLIIPEKVGRYRHLYINLVPIQLIYDRWTDDYGAFWSGHLTDLKYRVEAKESL